MFRHVRSYRSLDLNSDAKPDIVGSAEAIPLPDGSVDSVLCTQMLEHVPHPWKVLSEIFRVLKPGGKVLLTAPQLNELHEEPLDFYRYTKYGLTVLCTEAGFTVLHMDQRGKYHAFLAQTRIRRWIDRLHPYERKAWMYVLGPWSRLYTAYALWRDAHDTTVASAKHVIGWAAVLEKPRA
jgi:SAM-dependent methyltransferase